MIQKNKIFYLANIRFPSERAHSVQVAYMCSAFAEGRDSLGRSYEVELIVPFRDGQITENQSDYFGTRDNFKVTYVKVFDSVKYGLIGFLFESLVFAYRASKIVKSAGSSADYRKLIYTRDTLPIIFLASIGVFYEAHQFRKNILSRFLLRRAKGIIAISNQLKGAYVKAGFDEKMIFVAHDGFENYGVTATESKIEIRRKLNLPLEKQIVMYIGGLEKWKGAETLCKSSSILEQHGIKVAIIGGDNEELRKYKLKYPFVIFLNSRPYRDLIYNQKAADVLVVPNSKIMESRKIFTSPLKLFAHMSSGVSLVVSNVPALYEIVSSDDAYFFRPDDPADLSETILKILSPIERIESRKKTMSAKSRASDFTWSRRAEKVINYINSCLLKKF